MSLKVLIVDDSAVVRQILSKDLIGIPIVEAIETAPDAYVARDKILNFKPDVVILDIEMPRMDGISFLKKIMRYNPLPVIILSSTTQKASENALKALEYGAVEVLAKPGGPYSVIDVKTQLIESIKSASVAVIEKLKKSQKKMISNLPDFPAKRVSGGIL